MKPFKIRIIEKQGRKLVETFGDKTFIEGEADILELIGLCGEFEADRLMIHGEILAESFFDLKSGRAGSIIQKLVNYHVRTAAVLSQDQIRGRFADFVAETNRGNHFRVFFDRQKAESWLLSD